MSDLGKLSNSDLLQGWIDSLNYNEAMNCFAEIMERMSSTEPDWEPIETAPKDGAWVLLWVPGEGRQRGANIGAWHETTRGRPKEWASKEGERISGPSHWEPITKGPKE